MGEFSSQQLSIEQGFLFRSKAGSIDLWRLSTTSGLIVWRALRNGRIVGEHFDARRLGIPVRFGDIDGDRRRAHGLTFREWRTAITELAE